MFHEILGIYYDHASCCGQWQLLRRPRWMLSNNAEQLGPEQMTPKLERPPIYFDADHLLDDLSSELPHFVDLLYANFPYFYGSVSDAAEFLNQVS